MRKYVIICQRVTMALNIRQQIELGNNLLDEFHRLDKEVADWGLLQYGDNRAILTHDIEFFNDQSEKFIDRLQDDIDSRTIHLKSKQREYVNDYEIGSPKLNDFYSYGITIEQIVKKLKTLKDGSPKSQPKQDGKFHYIAKDKVLYRDNNELRIRSQFFKSESIFEVVFENAPEWVPAIEIGDRQEEKSEQAGDIDNEPYRWIRPACTRLNKKIRCRFEIEFDLLEKGEQQVRLNPKAI